MPRITFTIEANLPINHHDSGSPYDFYDKLTAKIEKWLATYGPKLEYWGCESDESDDPDDADQVICTACGGVCHLEPTMHDCT